VFGDEGRAHGGILGGMSLCPATEHRP
jgi:hypothetical protein